MRAVLMGMAAGSVLLLAGTAAHADAALATSSGCLNCHQVEVKTVGPALKDMAAKYAGDAGAGAMLAGKIKNGSNGVWGAIPMPPNAAVSDENAKVLADWILTLK
ncbi:MAG: c-type cytochrome [Nitrosomonas sp.]|nr:c-type cytochrome [Nitrosomonas sp.]MDP1951642.1 c-type cytochrome [Nitrosomonas sp.]